MLYCNKHSIRLTLFRNMSCLARTALRSLRLLRGCLFSPQPGRAQQPMSWLPRLFGDVQPEPASSNLTLNVGRPKPAAHVRLCCTAAATAEPSPKGGAVKPRRRRSSAQAAEASEVKDVGKVGRGRSRRQAAPPQGASSSSSRKGSGGSNRASSAVDEQPTGAEARERMLVVDASALLYRAHHAALAPGGQLTNEHGEDTSVLYRFFRSLFILLEGPPPATHFAVVLDSGGPTFRHKLDPGYKGSREGCPTRVVDAANRLRSLLPLMGIPVVKEVGWEADDLIGSLATRAVEAGLHVSVASPDKDFLQLLRPGLDLLRMPVGTAGRAKYTSAPYTHLDFEQDYGIPPQLYPAVLALAGDPADNIPGLPGIGEKSAIALLQQFGSLQGALDGAEQVKRKPVREALLAPSAAQHALIYLQLASISCDGELPSLQHSMDHWRLRAVDEGAAAAALREFEWLGFKSLMAPLRGHLQRLEEAAA